MNTPVGLLGAVDSASALRCGFAGLHPISIRNTVRRWGLRLTTIKWHFERRPSHTDLIENYPSYVSFMNDSVMNKINLPSAVDPKALAELLTEKTLEKFDKDHELKSALNKVEKERDSAKPFLEFTRFLRKRFDDKRTEGVQSKAEMFMSSNIPFSFFTNLVMANEIYEGFLDVMERKINLYESVWLHRARNNPVRFAAKFQEMKNSLNPLFDVMERTSFIQKCLGVLILASNCDDIASFFSVEFVDLKKIDSKQFEPLSIEFDNSLESCVSVIIGMEPNSFSKLPTTELNEVFSQVLL
jgi:hypothetical protein